MKYDGHRGRALLAAVTVALAALGVTVLVVGIRAQRQAPQPPPSAGGTFAGRQQTRTRSSSTPPSASGGQTSATEPHGPVLARSTPTHLSIPAIGVNSDLVQLGLNPDRSLQVPSLGADSQAGWYRYSPTPGQVGPSILLGHIDSARYGPGVFFNLGALRKGDTVSVRRSDNMVAVFRVDAVAEYPKNRFPTLTVYGNTDNAALRLITCGGKFNLSSHNYEDNIVAFASLVSSHAA